MKLAALVLSVLHCCLVALCAFHIRVDNRTGRARTMFSPLLSKFVLRVLQLVPQ